MEFAYHILLLLSPDQLGQQHRQSSRQKDHLPGTLTLPGPNLAILEWSCRGAYNLAKADQEEELMPSQYRKHESC